LSQEYIGLEFLGKILHGFKPCEIEKGMFLTHRFYFLIAQAFLFLIKNIIHGFKKISQMFLMIGFWQ